MAIKVLEAMLERAYGEAKGRRLQREARKWADSQGYHLITISKEDIKTLLVHNYVAIRKGLVSKEQADFNQAERNLGNMSVFGKKVNQTMFPENEKGRSCKKCSKYVTA